MELYSCLLLWHTGLKMEPQERADRWPKSLPKKTLTHSLPSLKELAFHHFQQRALLQSFNCLQLSKVIQHVAIQLQGEAGPMAGILPVHQNLMDFLHHLLRRNLKKVRTQTIMLYPPICSCQTLPLSCSIKSLSDLSRLGKADSTSLSRKITSAPAGRALSPLAGSAP